MLVLGIDTSTKMGSFSLFDDKIGVLGEFNFFVKKDHSSITMVALDYLFKITGYSISDVDKIAVVLGPGSFTGVRIGVSIAKGFGISLKKPVVGINSLDLLANIPEYCEKKIVSMIDARKERAFYSIYQHENNKLKRIFDYADGEIIEIKEILKKLKNSKDEKYIFIGDGALNNAELLKTLFQENCILLSKYNSIPRSIIAAELAVNIEPDNVYDMEPIYGGRSEKEKYKKVSK